MSVNRRTGGAARAIGAAQNAAAANSRKRERTDGIGMAFLPVSSSDPGRLLAFAEHFSREFQQVRAPLRPPVPRRQAGLEAELLEELGDAPPPLDGHLGQEEAATPPLLDVEAVLADDDLVG